jgi:hypothetical protein
MKQTLLTGLLLMLFSSLFAQKDSSSTFWKPSPPNYEVKHALEVEAVPFVYLSEGYHISLGYRYKKFRFRVSAINAGTFNSETKNNQFERFETRGTFGFFAGYNIWKNLETYVFVDRQVFDIKQKSTSEIKQINSVSPGLGIGYQFFIGRYFYIQPALHLYLRSANEITFSDNTTYSISTADITPVIRIGIRPWKKF